MSLYSWQWLVNISNPSNGGILCKKTYITWHGIWIMYLLIAKPSLCYGRNTGNKQRNKKTLSLWNIYFLLSYCSFKEDKYLKEKIMPNINRVLEKN